MYQNYAFSLEDLEADLAKYRQFAQALEAEWDQFLHTDLHLSFNPIRSLPNSFNRLIHLTYFYMQSIALETLPDSFGPFPELQKIDMRSNRLTTLPTQINSCPQLEEWDLGNNLLQEIPESIINCSRLRYINLTGNQFTALPRSLLHVDIPGMWHFEKNPLRPPHDFIFATIRNKNIEDRAILLQPALYLQAWSDFPDNLLTDLQQNKDPPEYLYTLLLHSTMGGFILQKCSTINTPTARRFADRLNNEYGKIDFGPYDIYLSL